MKRVAVIGSGISGLSAAYYLSRNFEVSVFERDTRIGGHTHTVDVETRASPLAPPETLGIDTGFIVHNDRTYPNLTRLLDELGIATAPSQMSFGVSDPNTGFQYSSRGLAGFFAQRANLFRPEHYLLLKEILRFNREAPGILTRPDLDGISMGEVMEEGRYAKVFQTHYLFPMAAAVWSMPPGSIANFPALTLLRFFDNHGMLGINTHPKWKVIAGGSRNYLKPLTAPFRDRITTGVEVSTVSRDETGVVLHFADRPAATFDEVVFACHGNQILPLLESPTPRERDILGHFRTSRNEACLHTDATLLPSREAAQAAWNYSLHPDPAQPATLTYNMNRLQSLQSATSFCVTLNDGGRIHPSAVIRRMVYHHPIYTADAVRAQTRWHEISGCNRTHFCGAYWFYGFHEDGLNSALRVARALGVSC